MKALQHINEVQIMYYGRTSEFLLMTSERMSIPDEGTTLKSILNLLRQRGDRWAYELDDSHVVCSVDGKCVALSDNIKARCELWISSQKSIFKA